MLIAFLITILGFFIMPFLTFGLGWIVGLIIKITIGNFLISGFTLFNLNVSLNDIPLFFATLSLIASFFFRNVYTNKN